ncbi:phage tail spike protein [Melissococcus plutonius]|uniref:phage tail spike protein n=1 Tax=Melissococcus plutonius TaxID=33970 RepID=UPI003C2F48E3
MSESIYFFDDAQQLIKVVKEEKIIEAIQEKEITTNQEELLNSTLSATIQFDEELAEAAFMAVREQEEFFTMYRIVTISDPDNHLIFTGVDFAPDELDGYIVKDVRPKNEAIETVAKRLVEGSEWRIGFVDDNIKTITDTFYYLSIKEALKQLQTVGCEMLFKCTLNADGIKDKWIEIYQKIGEDSQMRYTYGEKALTVEREIDRSQIYTSVIGHGKGEDVGDGYGRKLEFTNVEWKKSKGDPLDKPKGQNWLEFPEMTKLYGIPRKNGEMYRREKVVTFDDEEDATKLLEKAYQELLECSRPLAQFKATVSQGENVGNRVTIHRYDRGYHYQTRIFKTSLNRLTGAIEATIGDNLTTNLSRKTSKNANDIKELDNEKQNFYEATEISKWQSDVVRGAKGGSIMLMNPEDLGKSSSRQPTHMVWMNGQSIDKSNKFLVANSNGIGFIDGKFDLNRFNSAWKIDGEFNANFIKAGTLQAIDIRGVNIYGSMLESDSNGFKVIIKDGQVRFIRSSDNREMLAFSPTIASDTGKLIGVHLIKGRGFSFALAAKGQTKDSYRSVVEIPADSTMENLKLNLNGKISINGSLYINGQQVVPDQGGGSTPGGGTGTWGYPPEVTSQTDKWAWEVWNYLINNGYSKPAAAGILGNIQEETGHTMNPDTDQIGGPAYGLVQWDGSAYPLVGPATWNGREYVQRLLSAAKISEDYRTTLAQSKLINWSMYNGQWIGKVTPTSVEGYKKMNNPASAANVFELNFERPAAAHPVRQTYAQNWYNKFKNLKPGTNTGTAGLKHLESLMGHTVGNGQCYAASAEYSGYLGGCGLGAGTKYGFSHVVGDTSSAADIGSSYDWKAVGCKVIFNPSYNQLVTGAIVNIKRSGQWGTGWTVDAVYGHTGIIYGLSGGKIQTYEQNAEQGQIIAKYNRIYFNSSIASIVIPPK